MKKIIILLSVVLFFIGCSTNNNGTVTVIPIAPTNLTGTVISTTQINLSWIDNATNEDGYKVERKTGNGNYAVIGSMGANLSTYSDLGLTTNTTYTYRVYAYNSAGNSLQYSNELTLTTQDSIPSWLTNGLVGYWPFNGNANDESGNGNDGTVNGAMLTTDRFGNSEKAYSFNGDGNLINTSNPFYNGNNNHTISVWFNASNDLTDRMIFNTSPHGIEAYFLNYYLNPINNLTFALGNGTTWTTSPSGSYFPYSVNINSWHNFTIVANNTIYTFYIDGILTYTHNPISLPTNQLADVYFGGTPVGAGGGYFSGSLDDIRIYNRALTQSEVTYLATH